MATLAISSRSGNTQKAPTPQKETRTSIVAELIAEKRLPEIFGLLGLISDRATQEKLLGELPLLPWYAPNSSEGGIWREE